MIENQDKWNVWLAQPEVAFLLVLQRGTCGCLCNFRAVIITVTSAIMTAFSPLWARVQGFVIMKLTFLNLEPIKLDG